MGRAMIVFLLQGVALMTMLLQPVGASDGDVDYSSPYITVDPETGQLVTRNPGPHLKNHSMDMSGQTTADATATVNTETPRPAPVMDTAAGQTTADGLNAVTVAGIVAGLLVFGTLAVRRMKRKQ